MGLSLGVYRCRCRSRLTGKSHYAGEWKVRLESVVSSTNLPRYLGDTQAADINPTFKSHLAIKKHKPHPKYVSSMITQLRTGRVFYGLFSSKGEYPQLCLQFAAVELSQKQYTTYAFDAHTSS